MPADPAPGVLTGFHYDLQSPTAPSPPKTAVKTTDEFGSKAHFASGWNFGEAQAVLGLV
jgi:hypothetical protein